jgi:hypothetical protein
MLNQIKQYLLHLLKEPTVENKETFVYTEDQLMARLKFFIGICLSLTLFGIVFVVLYSLIFVTQPLNAISPIDQKFFELIVPIATFLTGTLSGIMLAGGDKDAQKQALAAANKGWDRPPTPIAPPPSSPSPTLGGGMMPSVRMPTMPTTPAFVAPPVDFAPQVVMSSTGKPMPVQPQQPEL